MCWILFCVRGGEGGCKLLDFYEDKNETVDGVKLISTSENITLYQLKSSTNKLPPPPRLPRDQPSVVNESIVIKISLSILFVKTGPRFVAFDDIEWREICITFAQNGKNPTADVSSKCGPP